MFFVKNLEVFKQSPFLGLPFDNLKPKFYRESLFSMYAHHVLLRSEFQRGTFHAQAPTGTLISYLLLLSERIASVSASIWWKAHLRVHVDIEWDDFPFLALHGAYLQVLSKLELFNRLKALSEVRLHRERVFGLREDLQQLVVRQEEEAGKREALRLEIVRQPFLDGLQQLVALDERV